MKVSVITVNLNNKKGLQKTIESVLSQIESDFEHIIIDGGSTDGSVNLIKGFEPVYLGIKRNFLWQSESDKGIYHAMNKGILKAKGDYCYFLNSGDTFYNEYVLQNVFELNDNKDLIYGQIVNNKNNVIYPEQIDVSFFLAHTIVHQAVFFKRELFQVYGMYDESLKFVSDWKFFLKIFKSDGCSTKRIDKAIANYDGSGITSQKDNLPKLYNESNRVKSEWFPSLFKEFEKLRRTSYLSIPNIWQLISGYVKYDFNAKEYIVDFSDQPGFYKTYVDLLNRQYHQEVTQYKNLYSKIRNSTSYRIGNMVVKPVNKISNLFKGL